MRTRTVIALLLGAGLGGAGAGAEETAPGLLVRLFDVGAEMRWLPELPAGQLPNVARVAPVLDLDAERKDDFGGLEANFITEVVGRLTIERPGRYILRLSSDDGAKLWLDDRLCIDHDGLHGMEPKDSAPLELAAGPHELRVLHFQGYGGAGLRLEWAETGGPAAEAARGGAVGDAGAAPGAEFVLVPADVLSHDARAGRETAPGRKRIIPPLRRGRPGDGTPVAGMHPAFAASDRGPRPAAADFGCQAGFLTRDGVPLFVVPALPAGPAGRARVFELPAGPYTGHLVAAITGEGLRFVADAGAAGSQGVTFRFSAGGEPALAPTGRTPFELLRVGALRNGLELEFTRPLDPRVGWDPESYYVEQWPFDFEQGKAPRRDGVAYPVKSVGVSADRTRVFLEVPGLKAAHVVYIRLLPPCLAEDGELPWSTEAWYTLNAIPQGRTGPTFEVGAPPREEPQNVLTEAERAAGWRLLFDGRTGAGWRGWRRDALPAGWQVRDGCLMLAADRSLPGGDICTIEQFDDFELALEWRIAPGGNSGIFFRASEEFDWCWRTAPEMQVLDNAEHPDGRSPLTSAGSNYALHAPVRDVTQPVGLFNRVRIVARGPHVEYWLNDVKVVEYELGSPEWERLVAESKFKDMPQYGRTRRGHIVLQDHGDRVWYRNIKIRPLGD